MAAVKWESSGLRLTLIAAGLQIIFAIVIAAVTATQLDGQDVYVEGQYAGAYGPTNSGNGYCVLNDVSTVPPGRVCDFVYITVGFGLFFSLLLLIPTLLALRKRSLFLDSVAISHSLFASFWWLVLAVTIQLRGNQAADAGYPQGSQRTAVIALSWLEFVLFFIVALLGVVDRFKFAKYKKAKKIATTQSEQQFKETHRATQALGATPIA